MIEGLLATAGRLEAVLTTGAALAGIIVFLKLIGKRQFKVWGVEVDLGYAWVVFCAFTCAHIYIAVRFVQRCLEIFTATEVSNQDAWKALTAGKLLWFDGLIARVEEVVTGTGIHLYVMDLSDPTTWLAHIAVVALFVAILRWREATWNVRVASLGAALVLSIVNWMVGSNWIIAASELSLEDPSKSTYLRRWQQLGEAGRSSDTLVSELDLEI